LTLHGIELNFSGVTSHDFLGGVMSVSKPIRTVTFQRVLLFRFSRMADFNQAINKYQKASRGNSQFPFCGFRSAPNFRMSVSNLELATRLNSTVKYQWRL
jgi:hypothetical protein